MSISVIGAGAFGTALAIALGQTQRVTLWGRDADHIADMRENRQNIRRLPGVSFPENLTLTDRVGDCYQCRYVATRRADAGACRFCGIK